MTAPASHGLTTSGRDFWTGIRRGASLFPGSHQRIQHPHRQAQRGAGAGKTRWGSRTTALENDRRPLEGYDPSEEAYVRNRILSVIDYLLLIQQK
jgi:hypothetical protein